MTKLDRVLSKMWSHGVEGTPVGASQAPGRKGFAWHVAVLAMLMACFTCQSVADMFADKIAQDNVWDLTRQADVVLVGEVTSVDSNISVAISQLLKGETADTSITFAAPPRPVPERRGICGSSARSWSFAIGEKWALFLVKNAGGYSFRDGRTSYLPETLVAVRQFLEVQALTNDTAKVQRLVMIVADPPGMSSYPAFLTLATLNKPESLELLAPLAGKPACKRAYISLLRDNRSPKAVDLLRGMLHTEGGGDLREVLNAVGRRDERNEGISKELLPFLDHADPVIRSTCVFILNYRGYHNGFPRIVRALDDPDPTVRASALAWPWYAYANDHPEVKAKIRKLLNDSDAQVRDAAKRALAGMSVWYRLWYYHH